MFTAIEIMGLRANMALSIGASVALMHTPLEEPRLQPM